MTMENKLSDNAIEVLNKRYFRRNKHGEVIEDWTGLCHRVASHITQAEKTTELGLEWGPKFFDVMYNLDFLPNSPTLRNAGANQGCLSACFVLPLEDSRKSIFKTLQDAVEVQAFGGGTGYDFSPLRPANSLIKTTGGRSCGPIGFMRVFDHDIGEIIEQGGVRKGAQMAILRIDHPDIEQFIECKQREGLFTHFNISVAVTRHFMECLSACGKEDFKWALRFGDEVGLEVSGQEVWNKLVRGAWANGEPGIIFIDTINELNPLRKYETIHATNPCGEQPLAPYSSCNLGSINLSNFVVSKPINRTETKTFSFKEFSSGYEKTIDWDRLKTVVQTAVRFLDNVIDVNNYPIPEIERETKKFRKIGLGVMGWADMLIKLGISYNSQEALDLAEEIMRFIKDTAWEYSDKLGLEKGSIYVETGLHLGVRNGTLTTIAPTGTLSLIAGCSAGIEPIFSFKYKKKCLDGEMEVTHPLLDEWITQCKFKYGEEHPFIEAKYVPIEQHIRMQAAFQRFTDNAVSKTINAPNSTTVEEVAAAFRLAFELGCKGITFYRQGSREVEAQVASPIVPSVTGFTSIPVEDFPEGTLQPPEWMIGGRQMIKTGEGTLWVHLFEDAETGYKELWSQISKEGRTISSMNAALGRLATLALNRGATWEEIEKQLRGIIGEKTAWFNGEQVLSPPDGIAKVIRRRILGNSDWPIKGGCSNGRMVGFDPASGGSIPSPPAIEKRCPDCGSGLQLTEGCQSGLCAVCGWSECG